MIPFLSALAFAADPCSDDDPLPGGPTRAWLWDGMLGLAQDACPETRVDVGARGLLLVDTPAFYGRIVGSGTIESRVALNDRTAIGLSLEPVHYESAISALSSSFLGYGSTSVTGTTRVDDGGPLVVAVVGRVTLPTAIGLYGHAWPVGGDAGLALDWRDGPWSAHGQLGWAALGAIGSGPTALATGLPMTAGAGWRPGRSFGTVLDLQSSVGFAAPLDHLAVAPALRFGGGRFGMELGGSVPLAGGNRTLAAFRLAGGGSF